MRYNINTIKRKKLIEKLFYSIIKNLNIDTGIPIELKFRTQNLYSTCKTYSDENGIIKQVITFNLEGSEFSSIYGYTDSYYDGRGSKVNPSVKGSRHKATRFILLHEIKHAIDRRIHADYKTWTDKDRELPCDTFAIENINKY